MGYLRLKASIYIRCRWAMNLYRLYEHSGNQWTTPSLSQHNRNVHLDDVDNDHISVGVCERYIYFWHAPTEHKHFKLNSYSHRFHHHSFNQPSFCHYHPIINLIKKITVSVVKWLYCMRYPFPQSLVPSQLNLTQLSINSLITDFLQVILLSLIFIFSRLRLMYNIGMPLSELERAYKTFFSWRNDGNWEKLADMIIFITSSFII